MKFKVDHYRVPGKARIFDILVFPAPENGWAYDNFPERSGPRVDGDIPAFKIYAIALAALIADPSKIIFFPLRKEQHPMGLGQTYHFAMMRPELQFQRSEWTRIHGKLDHHHWVGKYTIHYDRKKLDDYYKRFRDDLPSRVQYKMDKHYVEEIRGDTVFMVIPKERCYDFHFDITRLLDYYTDEKDLCYDTELGWVMSKKVLDKYKGKER